MPWCVSPAQWSMSLSVLFWPATINPSRGLGQRIRGARRPRRPRCSRRPAAMWRAAPSGLVPCSRGRRDHPEPRTTASQPRALTLRMCPEQTLQGTILHQDIWLLATAVVGRKCHSVRFGYRKAISSSELHVPGHRRVARADARFPDAPVPASRGRRSARPRR